MPSRRVEKQGCFATWLATVLLALLLAAPSSAQVLRRDALISPELRALSGRIAAVQQVLRDDFHLDRLFVGGGSSRAVLDHLYFERPLQVRDLDLFVIADRQVTPELARRMSDRLKAAWPGQQQKGGAERRPRGNPALPPQQSSHYNAGYGVFLQQPTGELIDLSLYHTPADLGLNGCLNIDTVMIPLSADETLAGQAERLRGKSYRRAVRSGLVLDDHHGYRGWQQNRLQVAHPAELTSKPVLWSIRLARSYAKASYNELPAGVARKLREGDRRAESRPSSKLVSRYLQRLLDDPRAEVELRWVKDLGILQRHAGCRRLLGPSRGWTVEGLRRRLAAPPIPAVPAPPAARAVRAPVTPAE